MYDECDVSESRSIDKYFVYQSLYINMTMADTSISQVLSESHSVIYGGCEEAKPQTKEVSLGMIHETLVRLEWRLSNILET